MAKTKFLYSNNARTTLAAPLASGSATFEVITASRFPTISDSTQFFMCTLDDGVHLEIVKVTGIAGTIFTCVRAQEGSVALDFASAFTKVEHRLTAVSLNAFARLEDRMQDFASVETLVDPSTINPNSVVCASTDANGNPIVATNNGTKWAFINYPDRIRVGTAGSGATTTSLNYANAAAALIEPLSRSYIVQFTSGANRGLCRFVTTILSGSFAWVTALPSAPGSSDTYEVYRCVSNLSYPKGGGSDKVFAENDQSVWNDYTVPVGRNASSAGPVSIQSGVTVTISSGSVWSVV